MNIGIVGIGVVGGTTAQFLGKVHKIYPYDRYKSPLDSQENLERLVGNSDVVFLCVPTPMKVSGEMDCSAIYHSLDALLAESVKQKRNHDGILVTVRSTAVSGTTDKLAEKYPFPIAYNPEFLTERNSLHDMKNTNKVVLGVGDERSRDKLLAVYSPIFPKASYIVVSRKEAEMIKYAENVMLTMQVAAANEIYQICKAIGIPYDKVKEAILLDPRIGRNISVPGPDGYLGFGGKCFPKDLNALIYLAREHGYRPDLLEEAWELNLKVRQKRDWLDIPGAISGNNNFSRG